MRYECYQCEWEGDEDEMVGETCPVCGSDNVDLSDVAETTTDYSWEAQGLEPGWGVPQ